MRIAIALVCGLIAAMALPGTTLADTPTPAAPSGIQRMTDPTSWTLPPADGPSQAQHGAFVYWKHCMACHGDQGQGLAKFRAFYPPQDQNCASRKCHEGPNSGAGFGFPDAPAIMGSNTLSHFQTAQDLYAFIHNRMPYQAPGSLSDSDYYALVAFLLQKHDVQVTQVDAQNVGSIGFNAQAALVFPPAEYGVVAVGGLLLALAAGFAWRRHHRST